MSFRLNPSQQISLHDCLWGLTPREQKMLENSWAKIFADDIFPNIDEDRFSVLYSDKASRPNTPVNVIVGALILKELFGLSDDEIVETLVMDVRFQYALHTTSFQEQPLSDKTLSRFRRRCYDYETTHGLDLYKDCVNDLSSALAKLMKIDGRILRVDSTMIEANIRKLSRMELIYTCNSKLVTYLSKKAPQIDLKGLEHYLDPDDYNRVIYHSRTENAEDRMQILLSEADRLLEICNGSYDDVTEYQLFTRCLSEQTLVEEGKRRLKHKQDGGMDSSMMQNPSDPEATYREKAGRKHRGYSLHIEESVGKNGSLITHYDVTTNNVSDEKTLKERLEEINPQKESVTMIADGAYGSVDNIDLAETKNIQLIPTDLVGRETNPIHAAFKMNEEGTRVLSCPAGHAPKSCSYSKATQQCQISFDRNQCVHCPYQDQCKPKIFKRVAKKAISRKSVVRSQARLEMKTEEFHWLARLRNGIETIPSLLKNLYGANAMPVRGLQKTKFFLGGKINAINFRKLFRFRKDMACYAQNPLLN